jgi:hypothetical protein
MLLSARYVNWFDEELDNFYGDNNNGLVHGIYVYEELEDFPCHVEWFSTEEDARKSLLTIGDK